MLSEAEGIVHDAHLLASLMKPPGDEELPLRYTSAIYRRRPFGRILWMLFEVEEIARDAHALALAIRQGHTIVQGDEINRLQREALNDAVSVTRGLMEEAIETIQVVVGIPPALFKYEASPER